ncbi:MAG: MATE family efflux transporter [Spirochaetales bacterium]|nr:MATE family efflux transporter [Spirochaetales bacterium]
MNKNMDKLANMDVKKLIIKMSLPAMISMLVQALYNIVDSIFVAKISEKALTALSLVFPIQMVIVAIFVGLGIGVNSYMSRKLGEKNKDQAVNTAEHGLFIAIAVWFILGISAFFLPQVFYKMFTTDEEVLLYSIQYTKIIMLFSFGSIVTEVCMNILRATGDMISSMKIQLLGALINIVLDPILIFGLFFIPALGVRGAAIATVIGQLSAMVFALNLVLKNKNGLKLNIKQFKFSREITTEIFKVGIPSMFMQLIGSVMLTGINFVLAGFSGTSVAVFGAYFKLQSFIFMPVFGLTQGMMPIVGFNYGAKNNKRVFDAVKFSVLYASLIMFTGLLVFQIFPTQLLSMFSSTPEMYSMGVICLKTISLGFVFSGAAIILTVYFQALGKAKISLVISFARQIIFLIPLAFGLSKVFGVKGVWMSFPISELACLLIAGAFTLRLLKSEKKREEKIVKIA